MPLMYTNIDTFLRRNKLPRLLLRPPAMTLMLTSMLKHLSLYLTRLTTRSMLQQARLLSGKIISSQLHNFHLTG